jgi:hypothetical protein
MMYQTNEVFPVGHDSGEQDTRQDVEVIETRTTRVGVTELV